MRGLPKQSMRQLKALEAVSGGTTGGAAEDYKRLKLPKGSFGAS